LVGTGCTPPGYIPRQASPPHLAAAAAAPTDAAALPAHHNLAIDLGVAGTHPVPPARSNRDTQSGTRRLESTPAHRRRAALRLAAWAAAVALFIGGVLAVSTAARRAAPPIADPAVSAQTRTNSPPPLPRPDDPTAALEQIRTQDAPIVESLAESWVAQLSTRPAGTQSTDRTATDAAILVGHDTLRKQHPGAVLLKSTNWNYDGQFWITIMNERFPTAEEANIWCDAHRFAPEDCFAKKLSHSGVVEGSAKYRR
jgi:hypothetical protein